MPIILGLILLFAVVFSLLAYVYLRITANPFEADNIIRKIISNGFIIIMAISAYYFFVYLSGPLNIEIYRIPVFSIVFILVFLFSYDFITASVEKFVNRYLLGIKTDYSKLLAKISDDISNLLDIKKIISAVKGELQSALGLKKIEILISYYKESGFRNEDGSQKLAPNDALFLKIARSRGKPFLAGEELIIPMMFKEEAAGAIILKKKQKKGIYYTSLEIAFLESVAFQTAVAVENTSLYEHLDDSMKEIKELHGGLSKKVEERSGEVKEKTEELNQLSAKLQETTRRKTEFLTNMSCELRTPLNAVLGFAELIRQNIYGSVSDKVKEAVAEMQKSGKHLTTLIDDVIDISKVEAGEIDLRMTNFSVKDVIRMVEFSTKPLLSSKKLYLKIKLGWGLPTAWGDPKRISQVLINLIGNSAKFAKKGGITLRVKKKDDNLLFEEEDTGIGIPPEKIGDVFKEFKQVHAGEYGGTGLGLAICKKLIELHGGKIWVESRLGKGTKFGFLLPLKQVKS